jgi:hypothetical protein
MDAEVRGFKNLKAGRSDCGEQPISTLEEHEMTKIEEAKKSEFWLVLDNDLDAVYGPYQQDADGKLYLVGNRNIVFNSVDHAERMHVGNGVGPFGSLEEAIEQKQGMEDEMDMSV